MKVIVVLLLGLAVSRGYSADPLVFQVTRDTWVSSYKTETEGNNGGSPKMKLKGVQELALIDIDVAALKGKRVTKAQLYLHGEGADPLGRVTVSSIADNWVEGSGTGYKRLPGVSSFAWSRTDEKRWGDDAPDITGVINGEGGSRWAFADASPRDASNWQVIEVDPAVVQDRIDGLSFGFAVMDDVGSEYLRDGNTFTYRPFLNRYVSSKDDKRSTRPYFSLWVEDGIAATSRVESALKSKPKAAALPALLSAASSSPLPIECRDEYGEPLPSLDFFAAKGETVCFSVAASASIELEGLKTKAYTMPLIEGLADPLVPVGFKASPVTGTGGTCLEIHVPANTPEGKIVGRVLVGTQSIPCSLTVWNFSLPDRLSFIPQMNCYGLPGHEMDYYRLAQEHRTTLNCLPYHWTGRIDDGPKIHSDGRWDWSAWDAKYGPLFDGSAFADLPRGAVPVETFYLMLNENWPMQHDSHFKGGYWIESAFDEAYWAEFRDASKSIAQHLKDRGWSEPMFEFYLNNKVSAKTAGWEKCTAGWILDEPSNTQDFWALRRYGQEFWKGIAAVPDMHLVYRADISRPQWQRDMLDGVTNVEVVSGSLRTYANRVIERSHRYGNLVYMYGSANAIGTANVSNAAWCVESWALGANGVVPWQTVGKPAAWQKADELSLFYPTANGPVPSLRLKAFRAGQQLVEYLAMFTALSGESREAVGAALLNEPGLRAKTVKKNEDDAGKAAFSNEAHRSIVALRMRLGQWLNAKRPPAKERWFDPHPQPHDETKVREIQALTTSP